MVSKLSYHYGISVFGQRGKKESTGVFRQEMATWSVETCHIPATEGLKKTAWVVFRSKRVGGPKTGTKRQGHRMLVEYLMLFSKGVVSLKKGFCDFWRGDLVCECACQQACGRESSSQDPHGWRGELTPAIWPLISLCTSWHVYIYTHTQYK